ncbi:hypothetical protein FHT32_004200 [Variovorax sp. SG517]|uniref:hypothetical protein n=1 Tax=Variovorax sp. SG517 TaxID=2587117 RepID=UPI00159E3A09|nr:hypothetical protein [Variovorax sp. SG517]NVM90543.1 hypothetical protein [Variovorax sp. SG517]
MKEITAAAQWIAAQNGLVEQVAIFGEDYRPWYRTMAQFDVHANPSKTQRGEIPWMVDGHSGVLDKFFRFGGPPVIRTRPVVRAPVIDGGIMAASLIAHTLTSRFVDYPPYYRLPAFVRCPRFVSRS